MLGNTLTIKTFDYIIKMCSMSKLLLCFVLFLGLHEDDFLCTSI